MTVEQVKTAINAGNSNDTLAYICGPPTMTDEIAAAIGQEGSGVIAAERVMTEKWW
jgi:NAD(P)H-flavin reductase